MAIINNPFLAGLFPNSPLFNNNAPAPGFQLVNPGGGSGANSTGNTLYDKLTGTNAQPIKASSPTAAKNSTSTLFVQIIVGVVGLILIIFGFVMITKTDITGIAMKAVKAAA